MSAHLLLFDELRSSLVRGIEALLFAALHCLDALPPLLLRALTQLLRLPLRSQQLLEPLAVLRLQSARQATSYSIIGIVGLLDIFAIEERTVRALACGAPRSPALEAHSSSAAGELESLLASCTDSLAGV